ncbi:MAG: hypothetical protein Q8P90_00150 [bacterium]|nr:hypothetical protein [bacterium]
MLKDNLNKIIIIGLIITLIIMVTILLLGTTLGLLYSSLPEHNPQDNQQNCESVGGEWSYNEEFCLLANKKAGEECTDGGQCESGACSPPTLTAEQETQLINEPIPNIVGTCYPDNEVTGCVDQVILGTISKDSMCL